MALFGSSYKAPNRLDSLLPEEEAECGETVELPEPKTNTVIAKDITLTGSLHGEGVVQIEGIVEGEIQLKGYIIVASTGQMKGPLEGDVVRIAGSVSGNILAHDHLQLEKTGSIAGDVTANSFVIEDGGCFNGRSTMEKPRSARSGSPGEEDVSFDDALEEI